MYMGGGSRENPRMVIVSLVIRALAPCALAVAWFWRFDQHGPARAGPRARPRARRPPRRPPVRRGF
jgi:hypothetical protein